MSATEVTEVLAEEVEMELLMVCQCGRKSLFKRAQDCR